jgi:hypothetical protein
MKDTAGYNGLEVAFKKRSTVVFRRAAVSRTAGVHCYSGSRETAIVTFSRDIRSMTKHSAQRQPCCQLIPTDGARLRQKCLKKSLTHALR